MQQPAQAPPSPSSSSFAGLLASFASPHPPGKNGPFWTDRDLGEDVATISYESALRAHARYRPADSDEGLGEPDANSQENDTKAPVVNGTERTEISTVDNASRIGQDGGLRRASVTVRLSRADLDRLRRRACEAGLTVSAYLRSCTFEVEMLRSQVKEALAQLRETGSKETRERASKKEVWRRNAGGSLGRVLGLVGRWWRGGSSESSN